MAEAQQTSDYPGGIDSWVSLTPKEDLAEVSDINKIKAAILAIQTELGVDPAGSVASVVVRLAKILADSGAIKQGTSFPGTTEAGLIFFRTDLDKLYIRNAANDAWDEIGQGVDYDDGTTYIEATAATERSTAVNDVYTKIKELSPLTRNGVVTITYEAKSSDNGQNKKFKTYINGSAAGAEKTVSSNVYATQTDSAIAVSAGDVVQVYAYVPGSETGNAMAQNLKIKCLNPTLSVEATGY